MDCCTCIDLVEEHQSIIQRQHQGDIFPSLTKHPLNDSNDKHSHWSHIKIISSSKLRMHFTDHEQQIEIRFTDHEQQIEIPPLSPVERR